MMKRKMTKTEMLINAVKRADRDIELENSTGFSRNTTIVANKKKYNRKSSKINKSNIYKYID